MDTLYLWLEWQKAIARTEWSSRQIALSWNEIQLSNVFSDIYSIS